METTAFIPIKNQEPSVFETQTDREARSLFSGYSCYHALSIDAGDFQIRTAGTINELFDVFRLRQDMFLGDIADNRNQLDWDYFDLQADHLYLYHQPTCQIVGTYRMISSDRASCFYSQTEFDMGFIHQLPGSLLEVGRACIHPDFRKGPALQLLWQGLGAYIKQTQPHWMFGCSSTHVIDPAKEAASLRAWLLTEHISPEEWRAYPQNPISIPKLELNTDVIQQAKAEVPTLLKYYLKLGAWVAGEPCWDPEFRTLDYLTLLDVTSIPERYMRRFGIL